MSNLTSVLLSMFCEEPGFDINNGDSPMLDKLDDFFESFKVKPLERVGIDGGDRNTHILMFGGGYSQFPREDLIMYLDEIDWSDPGNVVLVTQELGKPAQIWRPEGDFR